MPLSKRTQPRHRAVDVRVLALDTATEACSVALLIDGRLTGICREVTRGHADEILGMVQTVLAQAGLGLSELDGIAASVGPGSFTGVRICVSVAQGLAFGAGLPVAGVSTLEALASAAIRVGAQRVLACLDARMGEVYWGCFAADAAAGLQAIGSPAVSGAGAVRLPFAGRFAGRGRGFRAHPGLQQLAGLDLALGASDALPDARDMAGLGAIRLTAGAGLDPAELTPLYLRDKVAFTEAERAAAKGFNFRTD